MKKVLLYFTLFLFSFTAISKGIRYPVDEIPENLKQNAKVVVRYSSQHFTIESIEKGKLEIKKAITIMNKSGMQHSNFVAFYNKFLKIRNIKGAYYDKFGNEIKKIKSDELVDIPSISGYSLYEDNRIIYHDPEIEDFPFTFEYSYTINYNGFLNYPSWHIYEDYNVSVQESKFSATTPSDNLLRLYYQNLDVKPRRSVEEKKGIQKILYEWSISNYEAIDYEPFSPSAINYSPILFLAPSEFRIGEYKGTMLTWKDFGNWIYNLGIDKNNIPAESKEKILELVKDATTDIEKINILYKYMQDKTRYVNISVGLGGWQPFDAEVVDRLSYGDCKALSNYMKSILEIVGIKSHYTIIRAGTYSSEIISDFPMNQFNHAILCVPIQNDTLWLECTNQKIPAGYIGDFTDNRDALVIKKDESKLIRTKSYSVNESVQKRNITFKLSDCGDGIAEVNTKHIGLSTEDVYTLVDMPYEDTKRYLYENIEIGDFTINKINYSVLHKIIPEISEELNLKVKNYASVMGDRIIVPVNLMNKIDRVPKKVNDRKTDIIIKRSGRSIDSILYTIPEGYTIENIPENIKISSKFGEYTTELSQIDNTLFYKRTLIIKKGKFKPEEYDELRKFYMDISKRDNEKFVIKKI